MATITIYDDPMNPHGWALQPTIRRIRTSFPSLDWRIRAVPLAEDWETYGGPEIRGGMTGIAATCARVSESSGMPIDEYLWFEDRPKSSLPGCRLVALASEEDVTVADSPVDGAVAALRAVREATFIRRVNVTTEDGLEDVLAHSPVLDGSAVRAGLSDGRGEAALRTHRDLMPVDVPGVRTTGDRPELPTVVVEDGDRMRGHSGRSPYPRYERLIEQVVGASTTTGTPDVSSVLSQFSPEGWVAATEVSELTETPYDEAIETTRELGEDVIEREFAAEPFFREREYAPDGRDGTDEVDRTDDTTEVDGDVDGTDGISGR